MAQLQTEISQAAASRHERLLNRELSWLDFNDRVAALAADRSLPLLERVRFSAIVSSNLDEFFMVRVAGLANQLHANASVLSPDGRTPQETLAEIRTRVLALTEAQTRLWLEELRPALADQGIRVGRIEDCTDDEHGELKTRFERGIYPILTPLAVGPGQPFPYISGLSLSIGILARYGGEERFARVKVPESLPRFLDVGDRGLLLPLEDVIAAFLPRLFPGVEIVDRAVFRVTRDADFEISDEGDDLLEAVELELRRRRFGDVVRVEVAAGASDELVRRLCSGLRAGDEQLYRVDGLIDPSELAQLASLPRPDLKFEPWLPITPPRLRGGRAQIFDAIRKQPVLVHHPYDSFSDSVETFVGAAAQDPNVLALKTTVYRTSEDSALAPALTDAAEAGKQAVCLVELKARFDERRNIGWARRLEQAGVHVVYGFPDLKIHAKTTLVVRREGDELRRYAHIGTGNYHAFTAGIYEDFGLFTADEEITADVAELFNYLTGFGDPRRFRKLIVAPWLLRARLLEEIRQVAAAARNGERARIRLKLNSLTDERTIDALYEASRAGATIEIVVRGICSLRPGVPDLSENIRVVSVLGRFLEHSRFFVFERAHSVVYLLGSADLMPRNLDHRVEVVVPVEDERARRELKLVFERLLADTSRSWTLQPDGVWIRNTTENGNRPVRSQEAFMLRARRRARSGLAAV